LEASGVVDLGGVFFDEPARDAGELEVLVEPV
jgi:hypothetical protein